MNAEILLFDGFDELDAIGPWEVLQVAAAAGADLSTRLVTLDGAREVTAAHGLRVRVEDRFASGGYPELLVVPGGGWVARAAPGVRAEVERAALPAAIADAHRSGTVVASVCTGAMLLAAAGLLRDRPATTHHAALDDLRASGARLVDARVVDGGDLVTAGGVTSGIDLALWLVERFFGAPLARELERRLEHPRRGGIWLAGHDETAPADPKARALP
jgi:transcriptional regulator GlxA family with amidase domain